MNIQPLPLTLAILVTLAGCQNQPTVSHSPPAPACTAAANAIWTGVKLYQDAECTQLFATILGGSKNVIGPDGQPVQGVKLKLASGEIDWKTRESVQALAYIKTDDPAIARQEWQEFEDTSR